MKITFCRYIFSFACTLLLACSSFACAHENCSEAEICFHELIHESHCVCHDAHTPSNSFATIPQNIEVTSSRLFENAISDSSLNLMLFHERPAAENACTVKEHLRLSQILLQLATVRLLT